MSNEITPPPTVSVGIIGSPAGEPTSEQMSRTQDAAQLFRLLIIAKEYLSGLAEKHTGRVALQVAQRDLVLKDAERRVKEATAAKFEAEALVAQQQQAELWIVLLEAIRSADYLDDTAKGRLIRDLLLNNPKAPLAVRRLLHLLVFGISDLQQPEAVDCALTAQPPARP